MATIEINELNIPVTQTITGIRLNNARQVERTDEGVKSNVDVTLLSGGKPLRNHLVRQAIKSNTIATWAELDSKAQELYTKDYVALTVEESQQVQGEVFAYKMITSINDANVGISVEDVNALVQVIIQALV